MLGLDRGIAAGFYRRNERIGMPIVTVPGRRRQLRQEPTISVVCRAAHGFLRSTTAPTPPLVEFGIRRTPLQFSVLARFSKGV